MQVSEFKVTEEIGMRVVIIQNVSSNIDVYECFEGFILSKKERDLVKVSISHIWDIPVSQITDNDVYNNIVDRQDVDNLIDLGLSLIHSGQVLAF